MKKNKYKIIVFTIIALIIVVQAFAKPYRVSGDCMEPTITDGQLCLVNHISPYVRQYRIGDIISFKYEGKVWVSRVVALENNTIQIAEGSVVVNGVPFQDAGIHRNWSNWKHGVYAIDMPLEGPAGSRFRTI